jgi:hypothetical protein
MAKKSSQEIVEERAEAREASSVQCFPEPTSGSPAEQLPPVVLQRARKPMPRTDPELQAMARIDRILAELDGNQQRRVVEWIRDRFGPQPRYGTFCLPGEAGNSPDTVKESTR